MKQSIHPVAVVVIVVAVVMVVAGLAVSVWQAPSVTGIKPVSRAEVNAAMRDAHAGPTAEQRQQIQEWKKAHPGAYTKY